MWVGWHWWLLSCGACRGIHSQGNRGAWSVISLLRQCPPRKVTRSVGSEGSSPKSSSKLNLACFFTGSLGGHSSIGSCRGGGCPSVCMWEHHLFHILLLGFPWPEDAGEDQPRKQPSHSSAWDEITRGLSELDDKCLLGVWGKVSTNGCWNKGLQHIIVVHSYAWNRNVTFLILIATSQRVFPLDNLAASAPQGPS